MNNVNKVPKYCKSFDSPKYILRTVYNHSVVTKLNIVNNLKINQSVGQGNTLTVSLPPGEKKNTIEISIGRFFFQNLAKAYG